MFLYLKDLQLSAQQNKINKDVFQKLEICKKDELEAKSYKKKQKK